MTKQKTFEFEIALKRLEEIVTSLEGKNESLENSMKLFEEGVRLVQNCKDQLQSAEERVRTLLKTENGFKEKPGT